MDRRYLLTYYKDVEVLGVKQYSIKTYEWFEDEEEMNDFIEDCNINPIEKIYITDAENL